MDETWNREVSWWCGIGSEPRRRGKAAGIEDCITKQDPAFHGIAVFPSQDKTHFRRGLDPSATSSDLPRRMPGSHAPVVS